MSEVKWTIEKSPFEVYNVDHGRLEYEVCEGYEMIAALYVEPDSMRANLIAAAPELYVVAERLALALERLDSGHPLIAEYNAVSAKARGES